MAAGVKVTAGVVRETQRLELVLKALRGGGAAERVILLLICTQLKDFMRVNHICGNKILNTKSLVIINLPFGSTHQTS